MDGSVGCLPVGTGLAFGPGSAPSCSLPTPPAVLCLCLFESSPGMDLGRKPQDSGLVTGDRGRGHRGQDQPARRGAAAGGGPPFEDGCTGPVGGGGGLCPALPLPSWQSSGETGGSRVRLGLVSGSKAGLAFSPPAQNRHAEPLTDVLAGTTLTGGKRIYCFIKRSRIKLKNNKQKLET